MKRLWRWSWVLSLAACGGGEPAAQSGGGAPGRMALPVEVVAARVERVVDAVSATGQIEAVQSIELRPEVEGRLVEILMREGAEVAAGEPLFKVDDAELRTQVVRAEAELTLAEQALQRTRQLLEDKASSPADLERAEATARSNQAALDLLKLRLDRTLVRAPFAGVVGARLMSLGDYVTTATRLVTLQTVNPQRAVFGVAERYAERVRLGQRVTFRVAALAGRTFAGAVQFVDPVVQLPARTILVKAEVPNPDRALRAGMFIEAELVVETRPQAIVVPEDAVLPLEGADYVWVAVDSTVTRRSVTLGVRRPGWVEVLRGVEGGEHVVVGGLERLTEGARVLPQVVER